jgi:hypothetical protein
MVIIIQNLVLGILQHYNWIKDEGLCFEPGTH